MSKRQFKSQASSSRALPGVFRAQDGAFSSSAGFGTGQAFGTVSSSPLSYVYEPPDLKAISEPNVVVAYKNIQKKDSTTKAKALEDLQAYILALTKEKGDLEDAILQAWIKIYPRISIDSSRRVRQLSHTLQGQISVLCGKRIAKPMPNIVGAWLSGLYDNDKLVTRAANDAFTHVFPSEEKQQNVWRVYQPSILEYCRDAILNETVHTLSDERITSPDDAEAKYARVVSSAMSVVTKSLDTLHSPELEKQKSLYTEIFNEPRTWKFASYSDASVRRAVYRLLGSALTKQQEIDPTMISTHVLVEALHIDQTGSSYEYVKLLSRLSTHLPKVWTSNYTGSTKKSALKRLCQFLRKGSQGGPPEFWIEIRTLLQNLPPAILVPELDVFENEPSLSVEGTNLAVLEALQDGIGRKDEHRAGQNKAWEAYLCVAELVFPQTAPSESQRKFLENVIIPIIDQYLKPSLERTFWVAGGPDQQKICVDAVCFALKTSPAVIDYSWHRLSMDIIEDFQTSLPEQSKDYITSQDRIISRTKKWYSLQATVLGREGTNSIRTLSISTCFNELNSAIKVVTARNGKPYGVAAALSMALSILPSNTIGQNETREVLVDFAQKDTPDLLISPSSPYLVAFLDQLSSVADLHSVCRNASENLINAPDSSAKIKALVNLIASSWLHQEATSNLLVDVVMNSVRDALKGKGESWELVITSMENPSAPLQLIDQLLATEAESLSVDNEIKAGLYGIGLAIRYRSQALKDFCASPMGSAMLSKLLFLTESPQDDIAKNAQQLNTAIETIISSGKDSSKAYSSMVEIIKRGLETADHTSISVESLVNQAEKLFQKSNDSEKQSMAMQLLPEAAQWTASLRPFIEAVPEVSLAITNLLGGAIYMINQSSDSQGKGTEVVCRDIDGYSPALRMAWYTTKLAKCTAAFENLPDEHQIVICQHMAMFVQIASDALSVPGIQGLWEQHGSDVEIDIIDFIAEAQGLLANWIQVLSGSRQFLVDVVLDRLLVGSEGTSATAYYNGRAYAEISAELRESLGHTNGAKYEERLRMIRNTPDVIAAASFLTSASDLKGLLRLCNEYLASLTGLDLRDNAEDGLRQVVLLNCILQRQDQIVLEIPSQRIVFYVKHLVTSLQQSGISSYLAAELIKSLASVLPKIKDVYGSFWAGLIDEIIGTWSLYEELTNEELPRIHVSLRLHAVLRVLATQDSNEDLSEHWTAKEAAAADGLLSLMMAQSGIASEISQPRSIVHELLTRELSKLSPSHFSHPQDLYPLIACESTALQQSAYEILHQQIPANQEQVSLEAALTKGYIAKLPEELLSLVLAAPAPSALTTASFSSFMPVSLRSYLLSWMLIFDHWTNASYKVQTEYADCIKEGVYLKGLLNLIFDFLISGRSKPLDASRFDVESYSINVEDSPDKDTQWFLIHIYYRTLKHLPTLAKSWWRDESSRQLQLLVEAWTEKYISPFVIKAELATVSAWIPTQDTDDQTLEVKISPKAREITASYPVDDQTMSIVIRLPNSYPLHPISVEGINRVGVDEKKWRSWLITVQGVINFSSSSSSIIDGLIAWKKNVTGALKGQSECAICYSVVSADRQLPSKRCGTCKNSFHSACLFRWFKSSNSSSCPLCRNAFNYG